MKKFFLGMFFGWVFILIAGYVFLLSGAMPVRTMGNPLPLERFVAKTALHAAFRDDVNKVSPLPADEINLLAGAKLYRHDCAVCHGLPGQNKTAIAAGLFPRPPQLFKHGVDDDPIGETYWKIKNGIRLTGMPGFEGRYSETELWQVSLLLSKGADIPKTTNDTLSLAP